MDANSGEPWSEADISLSLPVSSSRQTCSLSRS